MTLTCSESKKEITVKNNHFIAIIDKMNGELVSVFYRKKDGSKGDLALAKDQLSIKLTGKMDTIVSTNQNAVQVEIEEKYDFYVKISSLIKFPGLKTELNLKRTYEFTRNKNIYEQVAFYSSTVKNTRSARKTTYTIEEDPITELQMEGYKGLRFNAGIRINLGVFTIHYDFTKAMYVSHTAGLGFTFR